MAYVLWTRHLRHDPSNPHWFNRDRFVLSAGHGSMLLYALLHLTGYDLPLAELRNFRQWGSRAPGHPERGVTPGVEATTGPLGQGFANGVGMAIAEAHLAACYNRPGFEIIDHCTYGLVSDGDLMEGIASEAASLSGHLKLGKLIYLYDDNRITLATSTQVTFTEDHALRFTSYGWQVLLVDDGNDVEAIDRAIYQAREETARPSLIIVRTHIGFGAPHKQDACAAHGAPLGKEEVLLAKQRLGWPIEPTFHVPIEVEAHFRRAVGRGHLANTDWATYVDGYGDSHPQLARELRQLITGQAPLGWDADIPHFPTDDEGMATRVASGIVLNSFVGRLPGLLGGAADLTPSTGTEMKGAGNFEHPSTAIGDLQGGSSGGWSYAGSNLQFGVREHAMGGILNGLALHGGTTPFGATFLAFSDYLRPAIRLAALMRVPVIYVFTHDSIAMGEDGPTHQPVEHLASLRAIPQLTVIRPADANEMAMAWRLAIEVLDGPVALILTRQTVPTLDRQLFTSADGVRRGAYVLSDDPQGRAILILVASGSEVGLMVSAGKVLRENGIAIRLVSMPSWELFETQSPEYRESVLPPDIPNRLAIEAGVTQGWHRYVGSRGEVLGIDGFGASAPGPIVVREFGFTVDNICERAMRLIGDGTCLMS